MRLRPGTSILIPRSFPLLYDIPVENTTMSAIILRFALTVLAFVWLTPFLPAQNSTEQGPTNDKAQKTYQEGMDYLHKRMTESALNSFKKADKQDGGHCVACQQK